MSAKRSARGIFLEWRAVFPGVEEGWEVGDEGREDDAEMGGVVGPRP